MIIQSYTFLLLKAKNYYYDTFSLLNFSIVKS